MSLRQGGLDAGRRSWLDHRLQLHPLPALRALWAYDYEGERISVNGETGSYTRTGRETSSLEILFCPACACVLAWRGLRLDRDGRQRMAVNMRLAPPDLVSDLPIDHFDGLDTFEDLPSKGRCVRDLWF
ncbi:hypothetical protein FHT78_000525 [Rhizobium sp. BK196]|nr:hypothetical protein [Rhizobium sp. BK196]